MHRYLGIITLTSKYVLSKHFGSDPTTSANPPVLIKGTHSDATNKIFFNKTNLLRQCLYTLYPNLPALKSIFLSNYHFPIHFIFKSYLIRYKCNKFRIGWFSFSCTDCITKHIFKYIYLPLIPCHFYCMTDCPFHTA